MEMLQTAQLGSSALELLLEARKRGEVDFKLVDVREVFEYTNNSITGTDLLIPTSMIQKHVNQFEAMKDEPVILYCRTGNRTGYVMSALHNMGLKNVIHLSAGIVSFGGETEMGAEIPNPL